jgi:hypothetical protein
MTRGQMLRESMVMLRHPTHGVTSCVPLHEFRDLLTAAEVEHARKHKCTSCGVTLIGPAWDGGCGRRLCSVCGPAEGCRRERPKKKRSAARTKGDTK